MPGHDSSDAVLLARARASEDRNSYAELVRRHQGKLRAMLRRLAKGDEALADDLAQEAFVLAWRKLPQFRGEALFSTWLYRIAYNCFLAHNRAAKPEDPLAEGDCMELDAATAPASRTDFRLDLDRALTALSEVERATIVQCYYNDLSHEEAAYALSMPLGTLKTHVLKAKQKLKLALAAWQREKIL